ncbi:unnamed protein product [Protopolystoma xenopodis]|uniref:Uncharacterized protein n=1 Tax=Protopolystoma xenopodis TaxID=117903 RepID=A0A3S5FG00_9PLAT|nr:unnamed protein product [Protopolystoma xenopodis]
MTSDKIHARIHDASICDASDDLLFNEKLASRRSNTVRQGRRISKTRMLKRTMVQILLHTCISSATPTDRRSLFAIF